MCEFTAVVGSHAKVLNLVHGFPRYLLQSFTMKPTNIHGEEDITVQKLVLLARQAKCVLPPTMQHRLVVHVYLESATIFARTDLLDQQVSDGMFNSIKQGTLSG